MTWVFSRWVLSSGGVHTKGLLIIVLGMFGRNTNYRASVVTSHHFYPPEELLARREVFYFMQSCRVWEDVSWHGSTSTTLTVSCQRSVSWGQERLDYIPRGDSIVGSSFPILGLSVTLGNALPTPRALVTSPGSARLLGWGLSEVSACGRLRTSF